MESVQNFSAGWIPILDELHLFLYKFAIRAWPPAIHKIKKASLMIDNLKSIKPLDKNAGVFENKNKKIHGFLPFDLKN